MAAARLPVTQTTPTTATTRSSEKRVRSFFLYRPALLIDLVCVSDVLVAEIKRIVKDSEILKYVSSYDTLEELSANLIQGGRHQMAPEEQGRPSGARDPVG